MGTCWSTIQVGAEVLQSSATLISNAFRLISGPPSSESVGGCELAGGMGGWPLAPAVVLKPTGTNELPTIRELPCARPKTHVVGKQRQLPKSSRLDD